MRNHDKLESSHAEVFLGKGVLKICSKFTGEHPCRSAISIKLLEIKLPHGCPPVNLLHVFRTSFPKNTSEGLLSISWLHRHNHVQNIIYNEANIAVCVNHAVTSYGVPQRTFAPGACLRFTALDDLQNYNIAAGP